MSEMKFSCPACSQHISCSTAYCDQAIHCPNCLTEIRVPCSATANLNNTTPASKAPLPANGSGHGAANGAQKIAPVADEKELHCRCPVCQSHLRIPASAAAQSGDVFPSAELVVTTPAAQPPRPAAEPAAVTPLKTEREQKIAAERAAREITLYPKMKPRLDLVLGEKEKPSADSKDGENPPWMKEAA